MYKININWDKFDIKNKTMTRNFPNEINWNPNPNINKGGLVPVLFLQNNSRIVSLMRWGIDEYNRNNYVPFFRIESLKTKWLHLSLAPCIIPIKGFYLRNKEMKQYNYYFFKEKQDDTLYVAGFYCKQTNGNTSIYHVLILSQPTDKHSTLFAYQDRMPVFLPKNVISKWLTSKKDQNKLFDFLNKYQVNLSNPKQIGNWIADDSITNEHCLLQDKDEWFYEKESQEIDWESLFSKCDN